MGVNHSDASQSQLSKQSLITICWFNALLPRCFLSENLAMIIVIYPSHTVFSVPWIETHSELFLCFRVWRGRLQQEWQKNDGNHDTEEGGYGGIHSFWLFLYQLSSGNLETFLVNWSLTTAACCVQIEIFFFPYLMIKNVKFSDNFYRYVDLRSLSWTRRLLPGGVQPLQSGGETTGIWEALWEEARLCWEALCTPALHAAGRPAALTRPSWTCPAHRQPRGG